LEEKRQNRQYDHYIITSSRLVMLHQASYKKKANQILIFATHSRGIRARSIVLLLFLQKQNLDCQCVPPHCRDVSSL
jgi:hypothetical protein